MKKLHYGWVVWLGCVLMTLCICNLGITTYAVYQPYILAQNGFTNAQTSTLITVRSLVIFVTVFFTVAYYKWIGLRWGMTLAGLLMALGYALFGVAESYGVYCAAAALVGLSYGLGAVLPIAVLLGRWFARKRTFAQGLTASVSGLLALSFPSLVTRLVESLGLRTAFFTESAVMVLISAVAFLLIRDWPAQKGLEPYGADAPEETEKVIRRGRKMRKNSWLLLAPALLLTGVTGGVASGHLTMLTTSEGFDSHIAAMVITLCSLMSMPGSFLYGWLAEKLSTCAANWVFGTLYAVGFILLCMTGGSMILLYAAVCCYGIGGPMISVGMTAWAADLSTPEQYDKTLRRFQLLNSAGGLIFSSFPGILADRFGGSYVPAYICFAAFAVFILLAVQRTYKANGA